MGTLGNMDGSFDGVLKASEQLKGLPKIIQKYMTAGIFQDELGWAKHFDDDSIDKLGGVDSFIVQIMNLDKAQQDALLSVSKFSDGLKEEIERLLQAAQAGEKFNTQLFEQEASKDDKLSKGVLNEVMQTTGMKDADGNYLLPNTKDVCDLLEQYANDANNAQKAQELFNAGLLEQSDNGYKVSASLLKLIGAKKSDIVTTGIATAGQMAWNYAMQIGKQLLLSLGVAAVAFIATKLVDYIMNLKTHSEELVDAMNDSHDAAQQATKDVEEIQSKIDELNKSLKDAGVKKIEDIVDPTERERLQAINDMLQAQLELKKQLEKDANDKANADTSAVVNDKTEDSIVKTRTVNVSYAEGGANAGTHQVAEKVSKTESLEEHAAALNDLIDKRRELATAGKEDTQEYKDNEAAITSETEKIKTLSTAVSEQMGSYETDADSFSQYKDEYVAGTNAKAEKASVETVSNDLTVVKNTASGLQNSIDTINSDISDIQEQLKNVKPDPNAGREYDITYEDSKLNLLENGTVKTTVVIQGGGGGGGNSSVITIERLDGSALTVIAGDPAVINYNFTSVDNSGDDTGSATGVWYVGNTKVGTQTVIQGKNSFDVTQYLHSGDNTVKLQVTDSVGSVGTKTWTVNVVEFYLESTFDDTLVYSGEVTFRYTPYGNIAKTINFTIDGKTLGSTTSSVTGRQLTYAIPAQTHGAHLVEVSMTAEINGKQVTSNKIVKDIMWAIEGNATPIISCATKTASAKQYSNVAINYTVYDPSSSTATVTLEVDGAKTATLTVGRTVQTWTWKSADIGTHTLKIVCGSVSKTKLGTGRGKWCVCKRI